MKEFLTKLVRQEKLKFVEPSENLFKSYLAKSFSNFDSAKILLENSKLEEAVSLIYYSMYNLVLALLYRIGVKSENHSASIILLEKIFGLNNALIIKSKNERIDKQYYVGFKISKKEIEESLILAEEFNRNLKGFASGIGEKDIMNYRDRAKKLIIRPRTNPKYKI